MCRNMRQTIGGEMVLIVRPNGEWTFMIALVTVDYTKEFRCVKQ